MTSPVTPADPQSEHGRRLAAELTVVLDDIELAIAERKRTAQRRDKAA